MQQAKLEAKFRAIVSPLFGEAQAHGVVDAVRGLPSGSLEPLVAALQGCQH